MKFLFSVGDLCVHGSKCLTIPASDSQGASTRDMVHKDERTCIFLIAVINISIENKHLPSSSNNEKKW